MERIPITKEGFIVLEEELHNLKTVDRPKVISDIAEARDHGDLSENAEYHAARERQSFIEGKILELTNLIGRADVIDSSNFDNSKVRFGAFATIIDEDTDNEKTYQIVGATEANLKLNRISIESPIAKALIGKKVSDSIEVETPNGTKYYEITKISY